MRRVLLMSLLLVIPIVATEAAQPVPTTVNASSHSFSNNPVLSGVVAGLSRSGVLQIAFDARFTNPCHLEAGLDLRFLDVPAKAAAVNSAVPVHRLVLVNQRATAAGCPEIDSPVSRRFVGEVGRPAGIEQLIVMDCRESALADARRLQICGFRVDALRLPLAQQASARSLVPASLFPGQRLVKLSTVDVRFGAAAAMHYDLRFSVADANCAAPVAVAIFESRTGISDAQGSDVVDWVFVTQATRAGCAPDSPAGASAGPYRVSREINRDYGRTVAIVNPVHGGTVAEWPIRLYRRGR